MDSYKDKLVLIRNIGLFGLFGSMGTFAVVSIHEGNISWLNSNVFTWVGIGMTYLITLLYLVQIVLQIILLIAHKMKKI